MGPRAASWHDMWVTHFKRPEHHRFEGRSVAEVAELMGLDVVDAICELLLLEDQQVSFVSAGANMATMPRFVSHPLYMVGSDAVLIGDYPSPRTYGAFPIILAEFVREERWLGLPDAIRKMTSFPAQRLGLPDRGLLRDGFKADVVVFDAADREGAGHAARAEAVPDRHRAGDRERAGRRGPGPAHRRARGAGAPPRPRLDLSPAAP